MLLVRPSKIIGNQTRLLRAAIRPNVGAISTYLCASIIVDTAGISSAHHILAKPSHLTRRPNSTPTAISLGHAKPVTDSTQDGTQLEACSARTAVAALGVRIRKATTRLPLLPMRLATAEWCLPPLPLKAGNRNNSRWRTVSPETGHGAPSDSSFSN